MKILPLYILCIPSLHFRYLSPHYCVRNRLLRETYLRLLPRGLRQAGYKRPKGRPCSSIVFPFVYLDLKLLSLTDTTS
uniref:Uncharacterized protein n=1 Tax=Picea glauca TaxID=3330 RepID=A0A124GNX8_PICGL|nr:hypothetical protein ABT39_MTgene84 [Picea glauca]KUM50256.1 hypothetical protein ABT39_MTgene99 [Picea glauca]QHR90747.1 hypothetical protein Q903MT_gene4773 [Picea sitchensis]